ncbi:MAG: hypothetical protein ACLTSZ_03605 [Lachnospiraceae bacterium]
MKNGETLTIVGIVQPKEGATASMLTAGICYLKALDASRDRGGEEKSDCTGTARR